MQKELQKYKKAIREMAEELSFLRASIDVDDGDYQGDNSSRYNEKEIIKEYLRGE